MPYLDYIEETHGCTTGLSCLSFECASQSLVCYPGLRALAGSICAAYGFEAMEDRNERSGKQY